MGNSFGHIFKFHSFGESHGPAMGAVIDGCPAGLEFNQELLNKNLARRRPGQSEIVTSRDEQDSFEILSGIYKGKTLGTPITIVIRNQNTKPEHYTEIEKSPRIGHADDVWKDKFGHSDPRGGGRSSGRETVARVIAGSVAQMFVNNLCPETNVIAYTESIGDFKVQSNNDEIFNFIAEGLDRSLVRMPSLELSKKVEELLIKAKTEGKSYGGIAKLFIKNPQLGLGQPVFGKLKSEMTAAFMSIGAATGVELGAGFSSANEEGSRFHQQENKDVYGGIRGGISTGEDISFRIAFKPTSSVLDVAKKGRHDPCIVPRAIPVLESMSYLVLADHILLNRLDQI